MTVQGESQNEFITPYQDVLNNIIQRLMAARNTVWSEEFGLEGIDIDEEER